MWKQISKNKRNSLFIFIAMSLLLLLLGAFLGFMLSVRLEWNFLFGATFGAIMMMLVYWLLIVSGKQKSLPISVGENIHKVRKKDNPVLYNIVEEMSIAAGMPTMPDVYVMQLQAPNAFACGFTPQKSCVCVTTGLLELCNRDELQGVVAHEIAHIVNRDTSYLLYASIIIVIISTLLRSFSRSRGRGSAFFVLILLVFSLIGNLLYFLFSRKREYLADACAAQFTRYPVGLASALNKISNQEVVKSSSPAFKEDVLELKDNPYLKVSCITPVVSSFLGLYSTHPSTKDRIKILMSMSDGADFASYNKAYSSVTKASPVIHKSDVASCERTPIRIGEPMIGLVGLTGGELTPEIKKMEQEERIERRREVEDMMWKYEGYIFIECNCETKLKLPPSFKGKTVKCPHCRCKHLIN